MIEWASVLYSENGIGVNERYNHTMRWILQQSDWPYLVSTAYISATQLECQPHCRAYPQQTFNQEKHKAGGEYPL